jgi:regulatory protein
VDTAAGAAGVPPPADRWQAARAALAAAEALAAAGTGTGIGGAGADPGAVTGADTGPGTPSRGPAGETGDESARAHAACLNLLDHRARTRQELDRALARRGIEPETAAAVLDRLARVGLVDDAAFATAWVRERQQRRGLSRSALGAELRRRGVGEDHIAAAVGQVDDHGELAAARALIAARAARMGRLPAPARFRRLTGLLVRRGYPPGLAGRLVGELVDADAATGPAGYDG